MRRRVIQRMFLKILAITLLIGSAAHGQSLGDIARENEEKQNGNDASSTAKRKVITNEDLSKDSEANTGPSEAQSGASTAARKKAAANRSADRRFAEQRLAEQRAAEQWKSQILAQKNKMAILQAQIDRIHASIQSANGSVQYEEPVNWYQARQLRRVAQIQLQLDEQKRKLEQMQDEARHAGMHTAVYDP
jgi:hypothetical protein